MSDKTVWTIFWILNILPVTFGLNFVAVKYFALPPIPPAPLILQASLTHSVITLRHSLLVSEDNNNILFRQGGNAKAAEK